MSILEVRKHIDNARQILVGVVPNPTSQIDQITNALIYKFMDDMDQKAISIGGKAAFFVGNLEKYSWTQIMSKGHQEKMNLYVEGFIKIAEAKNIPPLFRNILKSAYLPYRQPETLGLFLKEINNFDYSHPEELGDAYEYLLSIMSSQGDAGQFRTPRHIIDFMVDVIDPKKDEAILDPACGTAGFLISSYKHILQFHQNEKNGKLLPQDKKALMENFEGYDIDPSMVRIAQVNMYLHQFKTPKIFQYDALSSEEKWNDRFDVILANPPFMSPKGGIKPHSKFMNSTRSEVLFVDYIMKHLTPKGRAAIIVPEGIIFQSGSSYKELRKNLVNDGLYAVASLPSGVFNPYSGVKTSILFFDIEVSKKKGEILFIKIENDGFHLGAQRRVIDKNDLPKATEILKKYKNGKKIDDKIVAYVARSEIAKNGDYNLSATRYIVAVDYSNAKWPMVELGEICNVIAGQSPEGQFYNEIGEGTPFYQGKTEFTDKYIGAPKKWTTKITKIAEKNDILMSVRAPVGPVNVATQRICIGRGIAAIQPVKANMEYIFGLLKAMQDLIKGNSGATFDSISKIDIEKIKIPLPPLEIQEQIVAELNSYQNIITGADQIFTNWKPKINIDPSWEVVKIGQVAKLMTGGTPLTSKKEYYGGDIKWLVSGDVSQGEIFDCEKRITEIALKESNARLLPKNSVLIALNGQGKTRGTVAILRTEAACNQSLVSIIPDQEKLVSEFLLYILKGKYQEIRNINGDNQRGGLNMPIIREIKIPLPPLKTQQKIAEQIESERQLVESAKKLIEIYEQKIKATIAKLWSE